MDNDLSEENQRLRDALNLITYVHHKQEVHLGPHRASGLEQHCIACIAQVAMHGDEFHGVNFRDAAILIRIELDKFQKP